MELELHSLLTSTLKMEVRVLKPIRNPKMHNMSGMILILLLRKAKFLLF
jgi:hypothetical protein